MISTQEKKLLDLQDLAPLCYEADPFSIDECFESCQHDLTHWDVSLGEADFDYDLYATIFTYTVNVWEAGVCRKSIKPSSFTVIDHDKDDKHDMDDMMNMNDGMDNKHDKHDKYDENDRDNMKGMDIIQTKQEEASGIEGFYIMFNGCCNNSAPSYFTKAITPKLKFQFLSGGWYWKTMIYPGFRDHFGFMIHGDVELTKGTYCVRTDYHCVCLPIAVPDLCNNQWRKKNKQWTQTKSSSDHHKSIDDKPIWAQH